ncbi:aminotransferase class III-fold pyridoxal phosphate-dependent enzyme [Massilia sp. CCM 8695]|uniref:Aminotransferase class III-fold pyridoxal phosphate-dependent enzyme n=2 Tax=Massilia frigida TaxID=2609281 RepID=A0ABX0N303_9BURK|nr:aminotransferase class III-fold pyridoxal phosphate-dependent enzyme [Massilia frigida]
MGVRHHAGRLAAVRRLEPGARRGAGGCGARIGIRTGVPGAVLGPVLPPLLAGSKNLAALVGCAPARRTWTGNRMKQSEHPVSQTYAKYINPSFIQLLGVLGYGRVFTRASDVWLWDSEGRRYLDCLAGFGSVNLGHNHPALIARLHQLLDEQVLHFCHTGPAAGAAALAEALAKRLAAPLEVSLFASSGAEAVEAGLKLARAATGRSDFVSCDGGFHGTTLGTLSVMGAERLRQPFEPLLAGCHRIPFGDLEALERVLRTHKPAAFLVEPLQAEGGVILPPPGYLRAAQDLCRARGTLLVLDEIQTGLGRTGTLFAHQAEDVVPDVLCLAKALSGGLAAISVAVTSRALFDKAYGGAGRFDLHSSTYQGNALACAAALKTLELIDDENLVARSALRGARLLDGLRERLRGHPLVKEIRGRGLLVGIEFGPTGSSWLDKLAPSLVDKVSEGMFGQWVAVRLLEAGILAQPASSRWNVLRLEPALTIGDEEIDSVVEAVGTILDEYRGIAPIVADVTRRAGAQWRGGWQF